MAMIEMTVEGIGIDPSNNPLVLLRDADRTVFVPIWIGPAEAVSIQMELDAKQPQRPMTHDLIANILRDLNIKLVKVTVNDFSESVYYASLHLQVGRGGDNLHEVDARPSDAIALALRTQAQIWVADDVAHKTGIQVEENAYPALPERSANEAGEAPIEELNRLSRLLEGLDLGEENR
jgi:bifunctional DNase/RNase